MLWQTHLLIPGAEPTVWLLGFVFGATVFGYNFSAAPARKYPAWVLGALSGLCFLKLFPAQQLALALPGMIWLLYYDRYRPGQGTGLRHFPVLKPVAIALAWAWVTVWLPLSPLQWTDAGVLFVGRAAFIFALALAYDLCDQPYDLKHGLHTLVLHLGPRNSRRLINAALALAAVCSGLNALLGVYSWSAALALALSLLLSARIIHRVVLRLEWGDWRKAVIDGLMVLQLGLVLLGVFAG